MSVIILAEVMCKIESDFEIYEPGAFSKYLFNVVAKV